MGTLLEFKLGVLINLVMFVRMYRSGTTVDMNGKCMYIPHRSMILL